MQQADLLNLLQLSDSAFPTGGFSHSCGLESSAQHGMVKSKDDLNGIMIECLENTGSFSLPFVTETFSKSCSVEDIVKLDNFYHISVTNHVSNRASTKQGKGLLGTVVHVYQNDDLLLLSQKLRHCHHAVVFGCVFSILGFDLSTTQTSFMSSVLRNIVSSAVRLDLIGPMEAQKMQKELNLVIPDIILRNKITTSENSAILFPTLDILQNRHDTLFSRLFYS